jgi:hypothetical protein
MLPGSDTSPNLSTSKTEAAKQVEHWCWSAVRRRCGVRAKLGYLQVRLSEFLSTLRENSSSEVTVQRSVYSMNEKEAPMASAILWL